MKTQSDFIDFAKIYLKAGDGGDGCMSFRREKHNPKGGPDGGNGGKGGDIYLVAKKDINTLTDIAFNPHIKAQSGENGKGSNLYGKKGKDTIIYVPCGTIIKENGKVVADLKNDGDIFLAAKGGQGGRGNLAFKTHNNPTPKFSEKGEKGEEKILTLELALLADVGLIGFPNAGKSTLLSRITLARPKIADYPFTTLSPNLGVVKHKDFSFLMADIPGLIENAHSGKGLGDKFLKHILRTRLLIHLIDPMGFNNIQPLKGIKIIENELKKFSPLMCEKEIIIAVNKADLPNSEKVFKQIKNTYRKRKCFFISSITGEGISKLLDYIIKILPSLPAPEIYSPQEYQDNEIKIDKGFSIEIDKNGNYIIKGKEIERLVQMTNFNQQEGINRLMNILKKIGINKTLIKMGIQEGDTVKISEFEFEWINQ